MRTKAEKGRARHRDIVTRYKRNEPACPTAHRARGGVITFAYRLPSPRGRAALDRARTIAAHILANHADHLDAHAAAAL